MSNQKQMEVLNSQDTEHVSGGEIPWQVTPNHNVIEPPVYLTQAIGEDGGDLPDLTLS